MAAAPRRTAFPNRISNSNNSISTSNTRRRFSTMLGMVAVAEVGAVVVVDTLLRGVTVTTAITTATAAAAAAAAAAV
jgi:hypothetical protein